MSNEAGGLVGGGWPEPPWRPNVFKENPLNWIATINCDPIIYIKTLVWIAINHRDPIIYKTTPNYFRISPSCR
jgi:hypothetical protein